MSQETITGLVIAGVVLAVACAGVVGWFVVVLRQLDQGWRGIQGRRRDLESMLKERGSLIPRLTEMTRHRLAGERDTLARLAPLRAQSIGGRSMREKAWAEGELDAGIARIIQAAEADAGLSGLTEFEETRLALEQSSGAIEDAARAYNEAVDAYNRRAAGFPGSFLAGLTGAPAAEFFGNPPAAPDTQRRDGKSGPRDCAARSV